MSIFNLQFFFTNESMTHKKDYNKSALVTVALFDKSFHPLRVWYGQNVSSSCVYMATILRKIESLGLSFVWTYLFCAGGRE